MKLEVPCAHEEKRKEEMNRGRKTEKKGERIKGRKKETERWKEGSFLLANKRNNRLNTVQSIKLPLHCPIN